MDDPHLSPAPRRARADGVGALRRFALGPSGSSEEVVAWGSPHHLGYIGVSGLPVRRYRADVELRTDGAGTVVDLARDLRRARARDRRRHPPDAQADDPGVRRPGLPLPPSAPTSIDRDVRQAAGGSG